MKKNDLRNMKPQALKKKLMASLSMLMIAAIMMTTTTLAWFVLSTAPEVTGIETQVGANGSLEIVLLNTDTRADMSAIRAGLGGGSLQENKITANNVWGNLIDLSYSEYGLGELTLLPARLDASASSGSYSVDLNKLLAVPNYGYDGRIIELTRDTASAVYREDDFLYSGAQDYGVRAIGTSDALSPQGSALNSAKSNISTWTKSAKSGAQAALSDNMTGLFDIIIEHSTDNKYNDTHKATLESMLTELDGVLSYIDGSMRQGLVAYAASQISEEALFAAARDRILNTENSLSGLIGDVSGVPAGFSVWVNKLDSMVNDHGLAVAACAELTDNDYTWDEIKGAMAFILNTDQLLINGKTISQITDPTELLGSGMIEMTLAPGSGLFADVADFAGNYLVTTKYMGMDVEMSTTSTESPSHLALLSAGVNELTPADGGEENTALPLTATYGYAIDLAFRCNAAEPDLVLQTAGVPRVSTGEQEEDEEGEASGSVQGGGSYMEFSSTDADFTLEQQLALMNAIRVGFVDDQGKILAIAKLNVTSKEVSGDMVKAPLYLYDYQFVTDETSGGLMLEMGERKLTDNQITPLEQNVAKAVTAVVWLDGDIVDNTMVSAKTSASLTGVLNLQFATTAELIAATEDSVMHYSADKSGLEAAMAAADELVSQGQGNYSNASWKTFMNAYRRGEDVNNNAVASQIEIRNALAKLSEAKSGLQKVTVNALSQNAAAIRSEILGTENKKDQGNELYTAIYTENSWKALSEAVTKAEETVALGDDATENQINDALTALEDAKEALEFAAYYVPYEYNGRLYYMASGQENAKDTYGRWYDSVFRRITDDVMILKLDAYAEEAVIAQIGQAEYIDNQVEYITPDIAFLQEVFSELRGVRIKEVRWDPFETRFFTNVSDESGIKLELTGQTGKAALGAVILTEDGVITKVSKQVEICGKADGAAVFNAQGSSIETLTVKAGDSVNISAGVSGGTEPVKSCTWASMNTGTASVREAGEKSAEIAGVSAGSTTIKVTVETKCGNTYTCELAVTVTE